MDKHEEYVLAHSLDLLAIENMIKELSSDDLEKTKATILKSLDKANTTLLKDFKVNFSNKERERALFFTTIRK